MLPVWGDAAGSSFSFLSGLISAKPVVVEAVPKEGPEIDFYHIKEALRLAPNGSLLTDDTPLHVARARVLDQFQLFHHVRVPS